MEKEDVVATPYEWLSDHILFSHSGEWRLQAPFTYDTTTGTKTPLNGLKRLLDKGMDDDLGTTDWEISPDRRWVLWNMELYNSVHVARIDGSQHHQTEFPGPGNCVGGVRWLDDSRHWVASYFDYVSGKVKQIFVGSVGPPYTLSSVPLSEDMKYGTQDMTVTDGETSIEIPVRIPDGKESAPAIPTVLHVTPDAKLLTIEQAPAGDRLAWLLDCHRVPTLATWIHRFYRRYPLRPRHTAELWISRPDGTEMREVGHIEIAANNEDEGAIPQYLRWLPDGKRLSFIYKDALYTVPAD